MSRGHFIVFEGIDGSGTTTQCRLLASYLQAAGVRITQTREPGGTPAAERMRRLVLDPLLGDIANRAELFLYAASRSQHVDELIEPALERGDVVICDRFIASSLAYQGYGRGLELDTVNEVNRIAIAGCRPDISLFLDLPPAVARERRGRRGESADRLEQAGDSLQQKVATGYRAIAKFDDRAHVFDAQLAADQLALAIRKRLRARWLWFPDEEDKA